MSRVPTWLLHHPIAHRGLHDVAHAIVENSLPAFWAAARAEYPIELDVRLLADGEVVVFHDRELDRLTAATGAIATRTSKELSKITLSDASTGDDPKREDARIPLLRDVLDLVAGATPLLIEIKNEGDAGALETATAAALLKYKGPFVIQSFNPDTLVWWREHAPGVVRGLLAGDFRYEPVDDETRRRLQNMEDLDRCAPDFIGYDIRLLPLERVARERSAGRPVIGWTARSRDEAERALAYVDNIIFEGFDPAGLRSAS
ncbi:MAG TPA: glycerophosphodiester phosphodiesterase family protein [Candidatus Krumholzibacteria bacterium]|nr:glycerophosphodiester phosphodiesterase family protein [Candidatus Krumholzibacteria bacterium]